MLIYAIYFFLQETKLWICRGRRGCWGERSYTQACLQCYLRTCFMPPTLDNIRLMWGKKSGRISYFFWENRTSCFIILVDTVILVWLVVIMLEQILILITSGCGLLFALNLLPNEIGLIPVCQTVGQSGEYLGVACIGWERGIGWSKCIHHNTRWIIHFKTLESTFTKQGLIGGHCAITGVQ
jgi:hypothetical protein